MFAEELSSSLSFVPIAPAARAMYYIRTKGLPRTRECWELLYPSVRQECRMWGEAMVKAGCFGRIESVTIVERGTS